MLNIIGLILLWILRIIGIILGLIIFLLLLLLFVPFKYDATGSFDNNIKVKVKFSWLLKFINGKFTMDDDGQNTIVRVLFFKVYPSKEKPDKEDKKAKKAKKAKKNKKSKGKNKAELTTDVKDASTLTQAEGIDSKDTLDSMNSSEQEDLDGIESTDTSTDNNQLSQESDNEECVASNEDQTEIQEQEESDHESNEVIGSDIKNKKSKKKKEKKKKDKKSKKDKEPNKNIEQAKELWAFLQEPENEGVLKFITKYIVKIIKWILPRKVYVNMELGLEDPALTGYIAAVTSIVYVATQKNIHIAPNFNEQVVKGDFRIKGRLYLYQLLYYIIRVIIDKRVRRLIKKVRS